MGFEVKFKNPFVGTFAFYRFLTAITFAATMLNPQAAEGLHVSGKLTHIKDTINDGAEFLGVDPHSATLAVTLLTVALFYLTTAMSVRWKRKSKNS